MNQARSSSRTHSRRGSHPRRWRVQHADCLQALQALPDQSVDAVITDPPYGINFEGLDWDGRQIRRAAAEPRQHQNADQPRGATRPAPFGTGSYDFTLKGMRTFETFSAMWGSECLRVLKPGGHIAIFGFPRTFHRLTAGIEGAGFQIRDVLMWLQGQGFPKSQNLTGDAEGWGTGLKPAYEPILLARRPIEGSTAENHAAHGTGAIHIAACRINDDQERPGEDRVRCTGMTDSRGRWPANLLLSHAPGCVDGRCNARCPAGMLGERQRFFFAAKTSRAERDAGCEQLARATTQTFKIGAEGRRCAQEHPVANIHPTVKPLPLMRWLVRLITPDGGLVLDPFTGSGSTGAAAVLEAKRFHGIEREAAYLPIARARIRHWAATGQPAAPHRGECR